MVSDDLHAKVRQMATASDSSSEIKVLAEFMLQICSELNASHALLLQEIREANARLIDRLDRLEQAVKNRPSP